MCPFLAQQEKEWPEIEFKRKDLRWMVAVISGLPTGARSAKECVNVSTCISIDLYKCVQDCASLLCASRLAWPL